MDARRTQPSGGEADQWPLPHVFGAIHSNQQIFISAVLYVRVDPLNRLGRHGIIYVLMWVTYFIGVPDVYEKSYTNAIFNKEAGHQ